jgi:hypothetical protein
MKAEVDADQVEIKTSWEATEACLEKMKANQEKIVAVAEHFESAPGVKATRGYSPSGLGFRCYRKNIQYHAIGATCTLDRGEAYS